MIFDIENNNSALDIGNQFEFNANYPLNGPCSKLLNQEKYVLDQYSMI